MSPPATFRDPAAIALAECELSGTDDGAVEIVEARPAHRSFPVRVGEGLGICLKTGPAHQVRADGREVTFPADALCIRPPGCVWSTEGTGPVGFLALDLYGPLVPAGLVAAAMTFASARTLPLRAYADALRARSVRKDDIIADLLTRLADAGLIAADELRRSGLARVALRARERLESDVRSAPTLAALARDSGTDRFALLRSFKAQFGTTPHAFLVTLRVERARRRIARGADLIEVAYESGFADQAHLTRAFKRVVGMTPGAYGRSVRAISFKSAAPVRFKLDACRR